MSELCALCPRNCEADRSAENVGFCGVPNEIYVARASLHMWEEPCLSGSNGSGTVFFMGCNLKCVYCQNHTIALGSAGSAQNTKTTVQQSSDASSRPGCNFPLRGKKLTPSDLAQVFLRLQQAGAHNINLVTPSHYVPQIRQALLLAKVDGLTLPIVYNSSGYELPDTLKLLDGLVDIYMPDFKYMSPTLAARYSNAPDYPEIAKAALAEMYRQTGKPVFAKAPDSPHGSGEKQVKTAGRNDVCAAEPLMTRGVLVRYLLLPGYLKDGKAVLEYLHTAYGDNIYISIMNQYTPQPAQLAGCPELNRRVTTYEYNSLVNYALTLGIENAYIQEGKTAEESFIPDFEDAGFLTFL
ncbi:MAG: radical SAM protein [Lachnospiraceae bacterium]|nr:radical SAM protein [Lachnospiraceae bacterium]